MRISDWSSDVCSSDLRGTVEFLRALHAELLGDQKALPVVDIRPRPIEIELAVVRVGPGRGAGQHVGRTGLERREGRLELERDELDLGRIAKNPGGGPTEVRLKSFPVALVVERAAARRPAGRHPAEQLAAFLDVVHSIAGRPDRKSTRLNSRP